MILNAEILVAAALARTRIAGDSRETALLMAFETVSADAIDYGKTGDTVSAMHASQSTR